MADRSEIQVEQRREEVLAEIETWKKEAPEGSHWIEKLSNFIHNLPNSGTKTGSMKTDFLSSWGKSLDVPYSEFNKNKDDQEAHSDLFLKQTPREFLASFHEALKNIPQMSTSEIDRLIEIRQKSLTSPQKVPSEKVSQKSRHALKYLYEYTLPLYVELRVMGYSHDDLTA
jgi:hypothetical protein